MNLGYQNPTAKDFDTWRTQFEQQFGLLLQRLGAVIDVNGTITAIRIQSKFNPTAFIDLPKDGGIKIENGGVERASFPP